MILDRATLDAFGSAIVIVNGAILMYKSIRALDGKSFRIPVWVFFYLLLSLLFFLLSVTIVALDLGNSQTGPGAALVNAIVVFSILTEPAQWSQHVKGRGTRESVTKKGPATDRHTGQP